MSFDSTVAGLATPTVRWKLDELSGTSAADASGNGNTGTIAGSPTLGSTSLLGDGSGTAITVSAGSSQQVSVSIADGAGANQPTFSCFVRAKPSNLTGTKTIIGRRIGAGVSFGWTIRMDGAALTFYPFPGFSGNTISFGNLTASQTYSIGLTYNVSTGATVAYLDGSLVASHTSPTIASGTVPFCVGGTGTEYFTGVLDEAIYWSGTLLSSGDMAALHAAAAAVPIVVSGSAFAAPSTFLDGAMPITLTGEAFVSPATMASGSALTAIRVDGDPFASVASFLDGFIQGQPIPGEAWHSSAVMLSGGVIKPVGTDTSNAFSGRQRGGSATVELTVPVTPTPATSTRGPRVDKAVPLPLPTLVNGRPT